MVRLGIIGPKPTEECRYAAALRALRDRIRISAVFDPVISKAAQIAPEFGAAVETGLLALARRSDVDALLLLDAGWYGAEAIRLLCTVAKPVFIANDAGQDAATLQALHWTAVNYGLTLMPELDLRYTPASSRLQELMATSLGPAKKVDVVLPTVPLRHDAPQTGDNAADRVLLNWFDWMRYVTRSSPKSLRVEHTATEEPAGVIQIVTEFHGGDSPIVATIRPDETGSGAKPSGHQQIECSSGVAVIEGPVSIRWQTGGEWTRETLSADRNEIEVMLDHFCRRVVGGLIPVADLSDLSRALRLLEAARESDRTGQPVSLNGAVDG